MNIFSKLPFTVSFLASNWQRTSSIFSDFHQNLFCIHCFFVVSDFCLLLYVYMYSTHLRRLYEWQFILVFIEFSISRNSKKREQPLDEQDVRRWEKKELNFNVSYFNYLWCKVIYLQMFHFLEYYLHILIIFLQYYLNSFAKAGV